MTIEEILELDKKITYRKLVYSKYKFSWGFIGLSIFIFGMLFILYWILLGFDIKKIWTLFLGIVSVFILGKYLFKKNTAIIKKHYKYSLLENGSWDYTSIIKIRKKTIRKELKGKINLTNENLFFIIECLKKETEVLNYNYSIFINGIIIIVSVYLGAFLGGFVNFTKDMNDYLEASKIIAGIFFLFLSLLLYIDFIIFRDFIISRKRYKNRLIRVFENIYIEINAT
jgi:hypothetical protein